MNKQLQALQSWVFFSANRIWHGCISWRKTLSYNSTFLGIIENYNTGNCLDSLRSLAEEVEDATIMLALKAAKKGKIVLNPADIGNNVLDWEYLVNCLSAPNFGGQPQTRYFDTQLSNSMKSLKMFGT